MASPTTLLGPSERYSETEGLVGVNSENEADVREDHPSTAEPGKPPARFSSFTGFIFIFNLVVGTGVLAMPSVLLKGGWILGVLFLVLVCFFSYVCLTFVVESMATANAVLCTRADNRSDDKIFEIVKQTELGEMAGLFYNGCGNVCFYVAFILYLFGDSVIYSTLVARSLITLIPQLRFDAVLVVFISLELLLCLRGMEDTKHVQIFTMIIRALALGMMIVLAFVKLANHSGPKNPVPLLQIAALPNLFGGAVYSFMCHHSIPGIITPIRNKSAVWRISGYAFLLVMALYLLLLISCGLAFGTDVQDPVTFNFSPDVYGWIGYALLLFPAITLASSFPIISISLRNNLDSLFVLLKIKTADTSWNLGLTLLAVLPASACAILGERHDVRVDDLVGLTGGLAGCAIMFIIPPCLVYLSRQSVKPEWPAKNPHSSPFASNFWVYTVLVWATAALSLSVGCKLRAYTHATED